MSWMKAIPGGEEDRGGRAAGGDDQGRAAAVSISSTASAVQPEVEVVGWPAGRPVASM
ncbi:hypothetical protein [Nocardia sp. NPDC005745]|uniref:hypothetical protein n=1 Tax=Nocardia sp. NPDC005745 TaxID=3157061 RepID=UPI0033CC1D6B